MGLLNFKLGAGSIKRLAIISLIAVPVVLGVKGFPSDLEAVAKKGGYPVEALDFISTQGYEKVFNDHGWGGYLIWKGVPVYIDGRNDVYSDILDGFANLGQTEKPIGEVIAETGAETILTGVNQMKDLALRESRFWQEAYRDESSVVYIRNR